MNKSHMHLLRTIKDFKQNIVVRKMVKLRNFASKIVNYLIVAQLVNNDR